MDNGKKVSRRGSIQATVVHDANRQGERFLVIPRDEVERLKEVYGVGVSAKRISKERKTYNGKQLLHPMDRMSPREVGKPC